MFSTRVWIGVLKLVFSRVLYFQVCQCWKRGFLFLLNISIALIEAQRFFLDSLRIWLWCLINLLFFPLGKCFPTLHFLTWIRFLNGYLLRKVEWHMTLTPTSTPDTNITTHKIIGVVGSPLYLAMPVSTTDIYKNS